jgi:hypothetical protein
VKLLTEYLERAIQLKNMAGQEPDSTFKDQLLAQARLIGSSPQSAQRAMGCPLQARNSSSDTLSSGRTHQQTPVVCCMTRNKSSSEKGLLIMG